MTAVRQGLPGATVWLVIRRNVDDPTVVTFYLSNAPATTPLPMLVRMSGMRWAVECSFAESKGEVGLDHYETRSWLGGHPHIALALLAHHCLCGYGCSWGTRRRCSRWSKCGCYW